MTGFRDGIEQAIEALPSPSQEERRRLGEISDANAAIRARVPILTPEEEQEEAERVRQRQEEREATAAERVRLQQEEEEAARKEEEAEKFRRYIAAATDSWGSIAGYSYAHWHATGKADEFRLKECPKRIGAAQGRVASQILALITEDGEFVNSRLTYPSELKVDKKVLDPQQRFATPRLHLIPGKRVSPTRALRGLSRLNISGWMLTANQVKSSNGSFHEHTEPYYGPSMYDGGSWNVEYRTSKRYHLDPDIYPCGLMLGNNGRPFTWYSSSRYGSVNAFRDMDFATPVIERHIAANISKEDLETPIEKQHLVVAWRSFLDQLIQSVAEEEVGRETRHQKRLAQLQQTS